MRAAAILLGAVGLGCGHPRPPTVAPVEPPVLDSFPTSDGGMVYASRYGGGDHGVVLGSNGCMTKESWDPQARELAAAGLRALAIDFRGQGKSRGGTTDAFQLDVLAAVRYLRATGSTRVSVIGASCAGDAAAQASVEARPGEIDDLVLLAFGGIAEPERMKGRKLFVVARDDANDEGPRLPRIRAQYQRTPGPKRFLLLEGSAHAQRIFGTVQGKRLMGEILEFLEAKRAVSNVPR